MTFRLRFLFVCILALIFSGETFARTSNPNTKAKAAGHVNESVRAQKRMAHLRHKRAASAKKSAAHTTAAKTTGTKTATAKTVATRTATAKLTAAKATTATATAARPASV